MVFVPLGGDLCCNAGCGRLSNTSIPYVAHLLGRVPASGEDECTRNSALPLEDANDLLRGFREPRRVQRGMFTATRTTEGLSSTGMASPCLPSDSR